MRVLLAEDDNMIAQAVAANLKDSGGLPATEDIDWEKYAIKYHYSWLKIVFLYINATFSVENLMT